MFGSNLYEKQIDENALALLFHRAYSLPDSHAGMVLASLHMYIAYGYIEAPGHDKSFGIDQALPKEAIDIFGQFLIENGEDPETVNAVMTSAWHEMVDDQRAKIEELETNIESIK